jgi:alginate O-acetyltransferase complex protein AlgI
MGSNESNGWREHCYGTFLYRGHAPTSCFAFGVGPVVYSSLSFLVFAAAFFIFWPFVRRRASWRWGYICLSSLLLYGWGDPRSLLIFFASAALAYLVGLGIKRRPRFQKPLLAISILGNLGLLILVRYLPFLVANISSALSLLGVGETWFDPSTVSFGLSQIGVGFYTLQSIAYTVDVYKGRTQLVREPLLLVAYLCFFPKLMAGPFTRSSHFLPQLRALRIPDEEERWLGLKGMVYGYFMKMVLADNLAPLVDRAFARMTHTGTLYWWTILVAFALQIYFDFAGYSSIAIGLSRWMGYQLPENFNHPYFSRSIGEFWTRWHISLSMWFRDYIFFPLSRARPGEVNAHLNMWLTMLLSGLWHGAAWTYVVWGGTLAFFISIERLTRWPWRVEKIPGGKALATVLVVLQVWLAWVFFRSQDLSQALQVFRYLFSFTGGMDLTVVKRAIFIFLGVLFELFAFYKLDRFNWAPAWSRKALAVVSLALLILCCVYLRGPGTRFIYVQF